MLVLSRKESESILIGDNVRITVITAADGRARIGIEAPRHVHILRQELSADAYPKHAPKPAQSEAVPRHPRQIEPLRSPAVESRPASTALELDAAPLAAFISQ